MSDENRYSFELAEGHKFSGVRDANGHGELHSLEDQPAFVYKDGTQWWYKNGKVHRDGDLPAVMWHNGVQEWFQNGRRHRENGPAVTYPNKPDIDPRCRGKNQWWQNGILVKDEVVPEGGRL